PDVINAFKNHYATRYANTSLMLHTYCVGRFIGYLHKTYPDLYLNDLKDCKKITKAMVTSYEENEIERMNQGVIQKSTLSKMLCSVKLFLDMLSTKKINHIQYFVRPSLRANGKRANEYVNLDEVLVMIESI